jgi:hypothetical protein
MENDPLTILDNREGSSLVSSWTEYLCLEKGANNQFMLSVKSYGVLGELSDYFNEKTSEYEVPREINGIEVKGCEDGLIVGGVLQDQSDNMYPLEFQIINSQEISDWLKDVADWDIAILPKILNILNAKYSSKNS